jgi:predicted  nucleic acid-binding Zn-ribbon protein
MSIQQITQENQRLNQQLNDANRKVEQLTQQLSEEKRKVLSKDSALKSIDTENRKNIAEIGRLHSENNRLTQAANRSVCGRSAARRSFAALRDAQ